LPRFLVLAIVNQPSFTPETLQSTTALLIEHSRPVKQISRRSS
jgi:hypothetical protein